MKHTLRAFAIGLFTAGVILLIVSYFTSSKVQDLSEMPIDDVVNQMKEKGYRVMTESEYITLSMNKDAKKENATESSDSEKADAASKDEKSDTAAKEESAKVDNTKQEDKAETTEKEKTEDKAKSYTLTIEAGMPSSTIANQLESNGIVDNADKFITYLEDNGYAVRIQLGDFKLTSDMSYQQIAEALTR